MQKNVPKYTPDFVRTVQFWAEASKRDVSYALCNDRRTLLWFANQRAVEYHPTLVLADRPDHVTHLVLDLDPPDADGFAMAVRAAAARSAGAGRRRVAGRRSRRVGRRASTSSSRSTTASMEDTAAATRAIAERAAALDPAIATTAFMKEDRGARCSSTRRASAAPRSWPPTAHGCGPVRRCRSR